MVPFPLPATPIDLFPLGLEGFMGPRRGPGEWATRFACGEAREVKAVCYQGICAQTALLAAGLSAGPRSP